MTGDEAQLLRAYSEQRSEQAFRAIVERHLKLVYAAAFRQVGDRGLAEEITQNVFTALARKPNAFRGESTLSSWLYKAAVFQASRCIRTELRRKRREEIAVELGTVANPTDSTWQDLAPLLDEAVLSLREPERTAVVLRYFDERPFGEVGRILGVSEEAARKRVSKALDTLTQFFRRRGFALPALTLSAPILTGISEAVPAGLAAVVAQTALRQVAVSTASGVLLALTNLMALTKTQTAAICLLVVAVPVALQTRGLAKASAELTASSHELKAIREDLANAEQLAAELRRQIDSTHQNITALEQGASTATAMAASTTATSEPAYYPWSADSAFVRVPKKLFERLAIATIAPNFSGSSEPAINDRIVEALRMSPDEAGQVRQLWAEARRRYTALLDSNLRLLDTNTPMRLPSMRQYSTLASGPWVGERVSFIGPGIPSIEQFSFELTPFPNESRALMEEFRKGLISTLEEERARIFWLNASNAFNVYIQQFDLDIPPFPPRKGPITISYQLSQDGQIRKEISNRGSWPLEEAAEKSEPSVMHPIFAKWHSWINEGRVMRTPAPANNP